MRSVTLFKALEMLEASQIEAEALESALYLITSIDLDQWSEKHATLKKKSEEGFDSFDHFHPVDLLNQRMDLGRYYGTTFVTGTYYLWQGINFFLRGSKLNEVPYREDCGGPFGEQLEEIANAIVAANSGLQVIW